jgi:SPX domain protein involved in polyphosphate accumulation
LKDIYVFKRIEKKYRIDESEKEALISLCSDRLVPDEHKNSTVCSLYLDTPDFRLIRTSIEAKTYKEKLRLRSYGTPSADSKVFLEIKKKFKGVVYKRRISATLGRALNYIENRVRPEESQIMNEIDYAMNFYGELKPRMLVAYEREAYYIKGLPNCRITFDSNVRYRDTDLSLENGSRGKAITEKGEYILEIKTDGAMPVWLAHTLDELCILPSSFSKYGKSYLDASGLSPINTETYEPEGEKEYVCTV